MNAPTREDVHVLSSDVKGFSGTAWLIKVRNRHFIISAIATETMAFPADSIGEITEWCESAVVHGAGHEACIAALLETLGGAS